MAKSVKLRIRCAKIPRRNPKTSGNSRSLQLQTRKRPTSHIGRFSMSSMWACVSQLKCRSGWQFEAAHTRLPPGLVRTAKLQRFRMTPVRSKEGRSGLTLGQWVLQEVKTVPGRPRPKHAVPVVISKLSTLHHHLSDAMAAWDRANSLSASSSWRPYTEVSS